MGNQNTQKFSHDVFISYSEKNKIVADAIVADFEQHGIKCWYAPRDIMPGKSWTESVQDAIKNCQIVIPLCTEDSNSSQQVSSEIAFAASKGKTIEPFLLSKDDMNNGVPNDPAGVHWMDAITQHLSMRIIELREKIRPMLAYPDDSPAPVNQQSTAPPDDNKTSSVNQTSYQRQDFRSWVNQNKGAIVVAFFICALILLLIGIRQLDRIHAQQAAEAAQAAQAAEEAKAAQEAKATEEAKAAQEAKAAEEAKAAQEAKAAEVVSVIHKGVAGNHIKWYMYNNGLLEIAGTGKMYDCKWDYDAQKAIQPWDIYRDMITNVIIDDGINYIGECSFRQCRNVTSIQIPKSVTSIGWCAFETCNGLREFIVAPDNPAFCSVDGVLFNKSMTTLLSYPAEKPGAEYTVPYGVTSIESFENCDLIIINMPDTVTEISGSAFAGCDMIEEIILPLNLTRIPSFVFWGCDSLKKVTIQENVKEIAGDAFLLCDNLKDIYYTGTRQQWSKISIGGSNDCLHKATIHFKD